MNNKLLAILLITLSQSAFALTEQTPWGVYSESDAINDVLYARSESCEYQADKEVRRIMPSIEVMCETTQAPISCVIDAIEAVREQLIIDCEAAK